MTALRDADAKMRGLPVTCEVTYKPAGSKITQTLRCTGDDYEVDTTLKLTDKGLVDVERFEVVGLFL